MRVHLPSEHDGEAKGLRVGDRVTFKVPGLREGSGKLVAIADRFVLVDIGEAEPIEIRRRWVE